LDLTGEAGVFCGKLLADLGADIIKVERPGGDAARSIGPHYGDVPHPEKSLFWSAFNTNKRSITLDIETPEGREELKSLVETADFFIESFSPGYLDGLGLGFETLSEINPKLIFTSITPFGQTGPHRDFKASDLVLWAMGGAMNPCGYSDRAPLRPSVPQAYLHGGLHAAVGTALALYNRHLTSRGQRVDVSIQEAVMLLGMIAPMWWFYNRLRGRRRGNRMGFSPLIAPLIVWPCRNGEVMFNIWGGVLGRLVARLVEWMAEEGRAGHLKDIEWDKLDMLRLSQEELAVIEKVFAAFFLEHTKEELAEQAFKRRFPLGPVNTVEDLAKDEQLRARDFWVELEHSALGRRLVYPGGPFKFSETPCTAPSAAAPRIGEHNSEIRSELTLSRRTAGVGVRDGTEAPYDSSEAAEIRDGALAGVKILDFSRQLAGPWSTAYLADFGAAVIKIESAANIDNMRTTGPYQGNVSGIDRGYPGIMVNSSKYAMALNLATEKGREIAKRLVGWADVVVENFGVGMMSRWGLDYAELRKINPSLVMISSSSQGQTGPLADLIGFGIDLQGRGGFTHITGWPDRASVPPQAAYTDVVVPWFGALAMLAALDHRKRTGQGQYIDLSQHEAAASFLSVPLLLYSATGRIWNRQGNRSPEAAPHGAYTCRGVDRWCVIAVLTESQWEAFCQAVGSPSWVRDRRFSTLAGRKANEDELDALIAQWTKEFTAEELMTLLQEAGVPAGVVQNAEDLLDNDPHVRERGFYTVLNKPGFGDCLHYGWPVRLSRTPAQQRCGPLYGEHTEYVCRHILDMPSEEFVELLNEGVLK
jgi:crotonobetainyl-CoA:carnitine CoA-transferase CaiB-like acyl-CoA transferase